MSILYVGVDVSKNYLDVALCLEQESFSLGKYANDEAGLTKLTQDVTQANQKHECDFIHLVVEPTGGYQLPLVILAFEQGWQVSLPNPKQVRDWAKGQGVRAKNDALDSRVLAKFGAKSKPKPENQLPEEIVALDSLLRRQEDLQKMLRDERNRLHALDYKAQASTAARESVERLIDLLEKELAQVEAAINDLLDQHPDLKEEARLLQTVSGVGRKTVLPLLVFLHRWQARTAGQGTAKGIVAFAGLDPQENGSGDSVWHPPTISKMGCTFTRHKLYMAAKGGVRAKSGPLRQFYDRLRGRDKPYRLTVVAAARKILVWAFAIFTRRVPFDPSLHLPNSA
jgi:transposase